MITDKSIEIIADQLGIATEHIYEVFVAAQPTIALIQMLCCVFIIGCAVLGLYVHKKLDWDDECPAIVAGIIFGLTGIIISLVIYDCARCYFLPEYTAIVKLMELTIGGI